MKVTMILAAAGALLCAHSGTAFALVTAEEAAKLSTSLTPMGAERAGNKEGTIPRWEGGYTKPLPGYTPGGVRPDPFADDKPTLTITGKNAAQHAEKLSDGTRALLAKHPGLRLDVYPTRRSAAAPQWVYDNTAKNATRAKLTNGGHAVEGAYGGIPFPIPTNGYEAIWNYRLSWLGESVEYSLGTWVVTPDGNKVQASAGDEYLQYPYNYKDGSLDSYKGIFQYGKFIQSRPSSRAGEAILVHESSSAEKARAIWQYLVGQRRVRRAPSVAYDTPDFVTSGVGFFDEAFMMFGPVDHHDFKLVGKKEMYVPYNNNRAAAADPDKLLGPQHLNPDLVRWELHRVWVVDATLSDGKRHVVPKRRYYLDEDSWQILMFDGWDAQGQLWRHNYTLTLLAPDLPALVGTVMWGGYDLRTGSYYLNAASNGLPTQYKAVPRRPADAFSPDDLAGRSVQ
ncbi:DUF1329 domain-containing protein [Azospirillum griseum]|uniref:DUF1329 domain-containing protein n=1 Tax=Azospirillum griseum TaxID=2496639 RepID=A0A3S0IHD8_9PROT|nr:DUF1329 domain-containing protein [Azospirillum griseum]RTR23031.1 DUF1329 domain-containing protein [Azospirillum griseum]